MNSAGLSVHNETCAIRTLLFWLFAVASLSIFCFVFVVVFRRLNVTRSKREPISFSVYFFGGE